MKSSKQNPDDAQLEKNDQERLHEAQMKLAQDLIARDEKNQFWKMIERIGKKLSNRYRRFGGWWQP